MCAALGMDTGNSVIFIVEGNNVRVVNSSAYALMRFQEQKSGKAEKTGLLSEEDATLCCSNPYSFSSIGRVVSSLMNIHIYIGKYVIFPSARIS